MDVNHPDNQLFPFNIDALSPFYSIGDTVSIKLINKLPSSSMNGLQLKVEKVIHIRIFSPLFKLLFRFFDREINFGIKLKNLVVKDLSELSMDSIHIFAISIYLRGCESCPKFNIRPCVRIWPGLVLKRVAARRVLFRCFNFKFSLSRAFFCTQRELFVVKMLIRLVSYLHNPVWGWLKVECVAATDIFNSVISLT